MVNCCLPIHSLVYEIKTEDVYEKFKTKIRLILVTIH